MSKKTRKQKVIAEYRRKMKLLQNLNYSESAKINETNDKILVNKDENQKNVINTQPENLSNENQKLKNFFIADSKKSIFLIIIIIGLEIIFYFANIKNYLKF